MTVTTPEGALLPLMTSHWRLQPYIAVPNANSKLDIIGEIIKNVSPFNFQMQNMLAPGFPPEKRSPPLPLKTQRESREERNYADQDRERLQELQKLVLSVYL